jgi:hypothetical protein
MREKLKLTAVLFVALAGVTAWQVVLRERERHAKEAAEAAVEKQKADEAAWERTVLAEARARTGECERLKGAGTLRLEGKAVVWDLTKGGARSAVNDLLPAELRASSADPAVTVFLITREQPVRCKTYGGPSPFRGGASEILSKALGKGGVKSSPPEPSGIPGYRVDRTVCVVSWPERRAIGCAVVTGEEPPESVFVSKGAREYRNDSLAPLKKWLLSLPRR